MMDVERNSKKWTLFSAKVVAYTTLCSGKGCLLVFLLLSVPTILGRLQTMKMTAIIISTIESLCSDALQIHELIKTNQN